MDSNVTAAEDRTTRPAVRRGLIERQRWRLFTEICGLALLAGLAACRQGDGQGTGMHEAIHIGFLPEISGAYQGQQELRGGELAVAEVNRAGGLEIGGRKLKVVLHIEDTPTDTPEEIVRIVRRLINQENVVALVGPSISTTAIPAASVAEDSRVPLISPNATSPEVTAGKRYAFRVAAGDDFQGRAMARFARHELAAEKAAVLYDVAAAYSRGIAEVFRAAFVEAGGEVVSFEAYTTGERDFRPKFERIRDRRPGVLFLPNYADDISVQAPQIRRLGLSLQLLGTDSWNYRPFLRLAELRGAFFSHHWHPAMAGDETREFMAAFRRLHGKDIENFPVNTYDAFGLLFEAIRRQGSLAGEQIRQGLASIEEHHGVGGTISYRGTGEPLRALAILEIASDTFRFRRQVEPEDRGSRDSS